MSEIVRNKGRLSGLSEDFRQFLRDRPSDVTHLTYFVETEGNWHSIDVPKSDIPTIIAHMSDEMTAPPAEAVAVASSAIYQLANRPTVGEDEVQIIVEMATYLAGVCLPDDDLTARRSAVLHVEIRRQWKHEMTANLHMMTDSEGDAAGSESMSRDPALGSAQILKMASATTKSKALHDGHVRGAISHRVPPRSLLTQ